MIYWKCTSGREGIGLAEAHRGRGDTTSESGCNSDRKRWNMQSLDANCGQHAAIVRGQWLSTATFIDCGGAHSSDHLLGVMEMRLWLLRASICQRMPWFVPGIAPELILDFARVH